eukprot:1160179-Pelagomonas_calceolata.AAC.7
MHQQHSGEIWGTLSVASRCERCLAESLSAGSAATVPFFDAHLTLLQKAGVAGAGWHVGRHVGWVCRPPCGGQPRAGAVWVCRPPHALRLRGQFPQVWRVGAEEHVQTPAAALQVLDRLQVAPPNPAALAVDLRDLPPCTRQLVYRQLIWHSCPPAGAAGPADMRWLWTRGAWACMRQLAAQKCCAAQHTPGLAGPVHHHHLLAPAAAAAAVAAAALLPQADPPQRRPPSVPAAQPPALVLLQAAAVEGASAEREGTSSAAAAVPAAGADGGCTPSSVEQEKGLKVCCVAACVRAVCLFEALRVPLLGLMSLQQLPSVARAAGSSGAAAAVLDWRDIRFLRARGWERVRARAGERGTRA